MLLVDADPQPTLSSYYAMREAAPAGLSELITRSAAADLPIPPEILPVRGACAMLAAEGRP